MPFELAAGAMLCPGQTTKQQPAGSHRQTWTLQNSGSSTAGQLPLHGFPSQQAVFSGEGPAGQSITGFVMHASTVHSAGAQMLQPTSSKLNPLLDVSMVPSGHRPSLGPPPSAVPGNKTIAPAHATTATVASPCRQSALDMRGAYHSRS